VFLATSALFAADHSISVVTLNLASRTDPGVVRSALDRAPQLSSADVYLFQEVYRSPDLPDVTHQFALAKGLQHEFRAAIPGRAGGQVGLAIVSRYPLSSVEVIQLPRNNLTVNSRNRIALLAVAETEAGPVHVFNLHLDTRISLDKRLRQIAPVIDRASKVDGGVIIGGDFNTNPLGWSKGIFPLPFHRSQAAGLYAFMLRSGLESSLPLGTTTHDVPGLQIDWLFTRQLHTRNFRVIRLPESDHHAVFAELETTGGRPLTSRAASRP
jgi:endonuclease/exonuclease/phosphatase family metal-dependent hydrolase